MIKSLLSLGGILVALPLLACAQIPQAGASPPAALTAAQQGESLYTAQCASCHGPGAKGDGPLAADLTTKVPDLTQHRTGPHPSGKTRWEIIQTGSEGTAMKGFAEVLSDAEMTLLHDHLRSLVHKGTDAACACGDGAGAGHGASCQGHGKSQARAGHGKGAGHGHGHGHGHGKAAGPRAAALASVTTLDLPTGPVTGPVKPTFLLNTSALKLATVTLGHGETMGRHTAPTTVTIQTLAGAGTLLLDGREETLAPGRLIALPPNAAHDVRATHQDGLVLLLHYLKRGAVKVP
ncbi:MAG: quercetin dioxygenase-like cupin family protein/mono/diheme cytochrome c family protein [Myxococcota bacterium]|jgi:quercetin dioxygenase-like cupin family protein/mono/diheme cytochrome c family protein